jgi:hypothetical protein
MYHLYHLFVEQQRSALHMLLKDSYDANVNASPGAAHVPGVHQAALANCFWGTRPGSFVEAIERLGDDVLNVLVILHDRVVALDACVWSNIEIIRNTWVESSGGFNVQVKDRQTMLALYEAGSATKLAKEPPAGYFSHPGCDTWRENSGPGNWSDHFLMGETWLNRHLDQIHIDWTNPLRCSPGLCVYDPRNGLAHLRQVHGTSQLSKLVSPFLADGLLAEARSQLAELRGDTGAAVVAKLIASNAGLRAAWQAQSPEQRRAWACQGKSGWDSMAAALGTPIRKHAQEVEDYFLMARGIVPGNPL